MRIRIHCAGLIVNIIVVRSSHTVRENLTKKVKFDVLFIYLDVEGVTADVTSVLAQCCPLLRHLELGGCPAIGDDAVLQLR
jgi:hypothetical protein